PFFLQHAFYNGRRQRVDGLDMVASYIARHGAMRFLGEYTPVDETAYGRATAAVLRTERGLEIGEVLCECTPQALQMITEPTKGQIVRAVSEADRTEAERLRQAEQVEFEKCKQFVQGRRLQMELVDVEHLFGGERIVFYFLAEKRVDFRELVKDLAREFRTRIEMRQIGV